MSATERYVMAAVLGVALGWLAAARTPEHDDTQLVRLLDGLVIGPGLLFAGLAPTIPVAARYVMAVVGGVTVGYNARAHLVPH